MTNFPLDQFDTISVDVLCEIDRTVIQAVNMRDRFICQCCGFRAAKYQQVMPRNRDTRDLDELLTVCIFCQQIRCLSSVSFMRSGVLIAFPEIENAELNRLAIEIYAARIGQDAYATAARSCLDVLMSKRQGAKDLIGTDDPAELARMIEFDRNDKMDTKVALDLSSIRLFPLDRRIVQEADLEFNMFPQILAFWRSRSGPLNQRAFPRLENFYRQFAIDK